MDLSSLQAKIKGASKEELVKMLGDIDLSSYNGKIRIAFKYSGGDPSLTTTYQVDEIKILGN